MKEGKRGIKEDRSWLGGQVEGSMHGAGSTGLGRAWREEELLIWDAGR